MDQILRDALVEQLGVRMVRGLRGVATRLTPLRLVLWAASGPASGIGWLDAATTALSGRAHRGLYRRRLARRRAWCQ